MKQLWKALTGRGTERVVASFGGARLVVNSEGRWELRGGTPEEVGQAREWISLFRHEAVPTLVPAAPRPSPRRPAPASRGAAPANGV